MSRPARHAAYIPRGDTPDLLPHVWTLPDPTRPWDRAAAIPDVEGLCRGVIAEVPPVNPRTWVEFEDDLLFLFEQVVVLTARYRPGPGIQFRPYLYERLRWRLRDEYRKLEGRRGEKPRPDSLDAALFDDRDGGGPGEDRLGRLVAGGAGDDPDDWAATGGGLLEGGDRLVDWAIGAVGYRESQRAPRGARSPARVG